MNYDNEHIAALRHQLENKHGRVYDQAQLMEHFWIQTFVGTEFVRVQQKSTGAIGTLEFTPKPRFYFSWVTLESDA